MSCHRCHHHPCSCRQAPAGDATPASPSSGGTCSPSLQLFLLDTLQACLPHITRRPLHFLASMLALQLRWSAEVLPSLPLGQPTGSTSTGSTGNLNAGEDRAVTVTGAVASLARSAASTVQWVQQAAGPQQLSAQEQTVARQLQGVALLQLTSIVLQLPQNLAAAAAVLPVPLQGGTPGAAAPAAGSRLPLMQAAAEGVVPLAQMLLRQLLATGIDGSSSSMQELQLLIDGAAEQATASGADPADLSCLCAREAAEGAAVVACAAAWAPGAAPQLRASISLQRVLPQAATVLLNLGAQHQSVALTLLPLGAVCQTARQAASTPACQLGASSAALDHLFAALVGIMSHNPVQLVRSCAHDAVQALLDAFQPGARLAQLEALMQVGCAGATCLQVLHRLCMFAVLCSCHACSACAGQPPSSCMIACCMEVTSLQ